MKAALRFWLHVVESGGGLAEPSGDTALVMLPRHLQEQFDLPMELEVTDDPDVARDDGVAFLGAGHPAIAKAADTLLAEADVGVIELAPPGRVPDLAELEEKARLRFPIAHGRLDLTEPPRPGTIGVVRLGALVRYALSDEDHFQEQLEQWTDTTTRLPISPEVGARLLSAPGQPATAGVGVDRAEVAEAILAAYQDIETAAARRRGYLAKDLAGSCREELARAEAYYAAALESIAKRRASAPDDRRALLDARSGSTRAERARRLAEIAEKYRGAHETQPFRLHLLRVPGLRLRARVRRGDRPYPLALTWVPAAGDFLDVRCPACARHAPLDAGKARLGCISCHTKPRTVPAAPAPTPPVKPGPAKPSATEPPAPNPAALPPPEAPASPARTPARPARTPARPARAPAQRQPAEPRPRGRGRELAGKQLVDAGAKLAVALWRAYGENDSRGMKRLLAPDSPMATAHRLFRSLAPGVTAGIPPATQPQQVSTHSYPHHVAGHYVTSGELITDPASYRYASVWRDDAGQRRIMQVFSYFGAPRFEQIPEPVEPLDPVALTIWRTATPRLGVQTALRALTAWWRCPQPAGLRARFEDRVLAAATERAVCYWGGGGPGGYEQAARAYGAPADEIRRAGALLQKLLKLTADQPW